jgi:hypothetical protein
MSNNPYGKYVEGEDLIESLDTTSRRIATIARGWSKDAYERSYAEGKWTGRQLMLHLAQCEMVFSNRLRFGLAQEDYVVQPFDQDPWMAVEDDADGAAALEAYVALRRLNLDLCRRLTPAQRTRTFQHPERGAIDVNWVITMFAGHERHHLPQIEAIGNE